MVNISSIEATVSEILAPASVVDLDLDYLEDPTLFKPSHNPKSPVRHQPDGGVDSEEDVEEEEDEEDGGSETCTDSMDLDDFVKIILLGRCGRRLLKVLVN
ncbi:hypothetical protein WDU94_010222 [Cyamophila willieti]